MFHAPKCQIYIGFYGKEVSSVAIVEVPCYHGGTGHMIGLCGDCDGKSNDLRTREGRILNGKPNMFARISDSYITDDSVQNIDKVIGALTADTE